MVHPIIDVWSFANIHVQNHYPRRISLLPMEKETPTGPNVHPTQLGLNSCEYNLFETKLQTIADWKESMMPEQMHVPYSPCHPLPPVVGEGWLSTSLYLFARL
ncbi:hypothetical protein EVA_15064 [gut metagenome]|uniref:Uncharacterized protein n=1 Tax=gut metagenome TaxID=749906 RepID=J9FQR6_9ZZZZ